MLCELDQVVPGDWLWGAIVSASVIRADDEEEEDLDELEEVDEPLEPLEQADDFNEDDFDDDFDDDFEEEPDDDDFNTSGGDAPIGRDDD